MKVNEVTIFFIITFFFLLFFHLCLLCFDHFLLYAYFIVPSTIYKRDMQCKGMLNCVEGNCLVIISIFTSNNLEINFNAFNASFSTLLFYNVIIIWNKRISWSFHRPSSSPSFLKILIFLLAFVDLFACSILFKFTTYVFPCKGNCICFKEYLFAA